MYVHEQRRLVYLAHPKTGSKSTRHALAQLGFVPSRTVPNSRPSCCGSSEFGGHHRPLIEHPGPEWTVFTTVRNHWDAWVSWWGYSSRDGEQFDRDFIDRILTRQTKYYPDPHRLWGLHSPFADRIVRFEDLQAGLDDVWGGPVPLPHHNISKKRERRPYHEFYTPKLRSWVARHYAEEIEELGYSFEDGA